MPRVLYNPSGKKRQLSCTIYSLTRAWEAAIEVQDCSRCLRRVIGPDCRELKFFNLNNRILFTHDLLDDYTCGYTTSETPFVAYVAIMSRRYETQASRFPFVSEQMFRAAWFAYVRIQSLEDDMKCPKCGPAPDVTIWDGVTLAFNRKHLLPSLQPPTIIHKGSAAREKTRYLYGQQALPDRDVRKLMQRVLRGPSLIQSKVSAQKETSDIDGGSDADSGEETEEEPTNESQDHPTTDKATLDLIQRAQSIPVLCSELLAINAGLAEVFERHFGLHAILRQQHPPDVYRQLFLQVWLGLRS